jgi:endonuclease G
MADRQRQIIDYFNTLSEPVPPPPMAGDFAEGAPLPPPGAESAFGLEEGVASPASQLVEPPPVQPESVLERLRQRGTPTETEFAVIVNGASEERVLQEAGLGGVRPANEALLTERPLPLGVVDIAAAAIAKVQAGEEPTPAGQFVLEAIVYPDLRPVIDVVNGALTTPPAGWEWLGGYRESLGKLLPSIGRIDIPGLPTLQYAGTGFVVGDDLILTNRHVAEIFVNGVGAGQQYLSFRSTLGVCLDPEYEVGDPEPGSGVNRYEVTDAVLVHPHWDAALLRVKAADGATLPPPLSLARRPPAFFGGGAKLNVAVIGYPMLDFRTDNIYEQMTVFRGIFGRKRVAPGFLTGFATANSKYGSVDAVVHDSSTLGGNSGSAIVDLTSGLVVGLHFGGAYLKANYGVPSWELAQDPQVTNLGVQFADLPGAPPAAAAGAAAPAWLKTWEAVRPLEPVVA